MHTAFTKAQIRGTSPACRGEQSDAAFRPPLLGFGFGLCFPFGKTEAVVGAVGKWESRVWARFQGSVEPVETALVFAGSHAPPFPCLFGVSLISFSPVLL